MSESFAELFEQSYAESKMRPGSIITATVIDVINDVVVVNAGLKSEGFIPVDQFYDENGEIEVNVGDEVDVALDAVEDGFGETRVSREKAKRLMAWKFLEDAHESNETVTGIITDRVKGGFTVDVKNIRAFLPGSLVDVRPVRDTSYLEGKPLEFKIIKIDQRRSNVVMSRRAVVENENSAERDAMLDQLKEGLVVSGVVKNLTDYGAFLDLGGIDGLLHITDMAWKRVKDPAEIVSIGAEVKVKILKFDREKNRVSLGLKQMRDDPWTDLTRRYLEGARLQGRVTNIADYGCFVELEEGVEGLVHVSEMDWTNKNVHPAKLVHVGAEVEVVILDVDQERRRISLGMKQCQSNPWEQFAALHNKGDKVTGMIKSITDFGIFIGLDGDIDGLVHLSDVSWAEDNEDTIHKYKKGEEIVAVILAIDAERERISLGIKQMKRDPFSNYVAENPKASVVAGVVQELEAKFITVQLADGINAQLKTSELSNDKKIEGARNEVKVGDKLEVKITAIDRKKRTISVSVKAKEYDEELAAVREYAPDSSSVAKLGDILKEHLDNKQE